MYGRRLGLSHRLHVKPIKGEYRGHRLPLLAYYVNARHIEQLMTYITMVLIVMVSISDYAYIERIACTLLQYFA